MCGLSKCRSGVSRDATATPPMKTEYPAQVLADVQNPHFASFLDGTRWVAASIVFLGHLRDPLFLGYGNLSAAERNPLVQAWYFVTGWFGPAVIVFFVLSGYLVGGIASARASVGSFSIGNYAVDRVSRLYVAFLPALVLTAVLDVAGSIWFADTGFWTHQHPMLAEKVSSAPFGSLLTPSLFFGNLLMLQTIAVPTFGSNMPLWTISLEFWFYAVFGLGALVALSKPRRQRVLFAIGLLLLALLLGKSFLIYMGLWLIGVASAFVPWRFFEKPWLAGFAFFGVLVATRLFQEALGQLSWGTWLRDYAVAFSFAWWLVSMRSTHFRLLGLTGRVNRFMADFSYSLYLIHFPLMLFLLGALHDTGQLESIARGYSPTSSTGLALHAILVIAIYLCAWLFASLTEHRTHLVRARLKSLVSRTRLPDNAVS